MSQSLDIAVIGATGTVGETLVQILEEREFPVGNLHLLASGESAGASVAYTVTATVSPGAAGNLTNTATVTPPDGVFDPDLGNNTSDDTDPITAVLTPFTVGAGAGGAAVAGYNPDGSPDPAATCTPA